MPGAGSSVWVWRCDLQRPCGAGAELGVAVAACCEAQLLLARSQDLLRLGYRNHAATSCTAFVAPSSVEMMVQVTGTLGIRSLALLQLCQATSFHCAVEVSMASSMVADSKEMLPRGVYELPPVRMELTAQEALVVSRLLVATVEPMAR